MKKYLIPLLIIFILLLPSCTCNIVKEGGVVLHGEIVNSTDKTEFYADEHIVYVTQSGKKYHREDCMYLSSSKIPISLEQAIAEGKEPCNKCYPNQ